MIGGLIKNNLIKTKYHNGSPLFIHYSVRRMMNLIKIDVYKVRSVSSEANSRVDIELIQGANKDFIALELNEKLAVV